MRLCVKWFLASLKTFVQYRSTWKRNWWIEVDSRYTPRTDWYCRPPSKKVWFFEFINRYGALIPSVIQIFNRNIKPTIVLDTIVRLLWKGDVKCQRTINFSLSAFNQALPIEIIVETYNLSCVAVEKTTSPILTALFCSKKNIIAKTAVLKACKTYSRLPHLSIIAVLRNVQIIFLPRSQTHSENFPSGEIDDDVRTNQNTQLNNWRIYRRPSGLPQLKRAFLNFLTVSHLEIVDDRREKGTSHEPVDPEKGTYIQPSPKRNQLRCTNCLVQSISELLHCGQEKIKSLFFEEKWYSLVSGRTKKERGQLSSLFWSFCTTQLPYLSQSRMIPQVHRRTTSNRSWLRYPYLVEPFWPVQKCETHRWHNVKRVISTI